MVALSCTLTVHFQEQLILPISVRRCSSLCFPAQYVPYLIFPAKRLEPGQVLRELDDELHRQDGHLGHVLEQPVRLRLRSLAAHGLDGNVVDAVEVLLCRVLVLVLSSE